MPTGSFPHFLSCSPHFAPYPSPSQPTGSHLTHSRLSKLLCPLLIPVVHSHTHARARARPHRHRSLCYSVAWSGRLLCRHRDSRHGERKERTCYCAEEGRVPGSCFERTHVHILALDDRTTGARDRACLSFLRIRSGAHLASCFIEYCN